MQPKEGYYAALERQRVGEASIRSRLDEERRATELDALEGLYTEMGMKAFTAFNSCLEWLSHLGGTRSSASAGDDGMRQVIRENLVPAVKELHGELENVLERLGRIEGSIAALEAGMRRIDKFTLEAFRNIKEIEERAQFDGDEANRANDYPLYRGRLAKEEAASLALEAAQRMKAQGRRLTLAAVAREAGLKYGQIVYAFGNKEGFMNALQTVPSHDDVPVQDGEYQRNESA